MLHQGHICDTTFTSHFCLVKRFVILHAMTYWLPRTCLCVCLYETGHLIKFRGTAPFSACHIGVHLFLFHACLFLSCLFLCHVCSFLSCLFLCYVRVFLSGIFAQDATWWMGGVLFIRVKASTICISWMSCEGAGRGRSRWDQGSLCHHCRVTVTGYLVELMSPKGNGGFKDPKLLCSR